MIVKLVGCDNPTCKQTGEPEHETKRSHRPPYGWFTSKVVSQGTGVNVTVETCSRDCITPAVIAAAYAEEDDSTDWKDLQ